jgi:hypothetical protein
VCSSVATCLSTPTQINKNDSSTQQLKNSKSVPTYSPNHSTSAALLEWANKSHNKCPTHAHSEVHT